MCANLLCVARPRHSKGESPGRARLKIARAAEVASALCSGGRGTARPFGDRFTPASPGYVRGAAASALGEMTVTTANAALARPALQESEVLAEGYDQLYGTAIAPIGDAAFASLAPAALGMRSGQITARATGLDQPTAVAIRWPGRNAVSFGRSARGRAGAAPDASGGLPLS
jgi:hypothetical protein